MRKKQKTIKIGLSFSEEQVHIIDSIVSNGVLGRKRSAVCKQIIMFYINEKYKILFDKPIRY